jgi:hypothetical protein
MIALLVWFFVALPWFLLDGWLAASLPAPDLTLVLCLFLGLYARPRAVPLLLISSALARACLSGGGLGFHVLALGIPIAILLPGRILFFRLWIWQVAGAVFLCFALPRIEGLLARLASSAPPPEPAAGLLACALLAPPAAWLLATLPPLKAFVERNE